MVWTRGVLEMGRNHVECEIFSPTTRQHVVPKILPACSRALPRTGGNVTFVRSAVRGARQTSLEPTRNIPNVCFRRWGEAHTMHPHNECTISSYTFSGTVVFSIERDKFWEIGARFQKEKDDKPWLRKSIPGGGGYSKNALKVK